MGFTGQISIAQGAFFGIGAYVSGILTKAGLPFVFAFFASGFMAVLAGLVIGFPSLLSRAFYCRM